MVEPFRLNIRTATPADVPAILRLERQANEAAHWSEETYNNIVAGIGPARVLFVADDGGAMSAFLCARVVGEEWDIENVVVAAGQRRRGFASALLEEVLKRARQQGTRHLLLEVRESNTAARGLYEKAGFGETGRRRGYYRDPAEDAICYRYVIR